MVDPPGVPRTKKGLSFFNTMVGVIELSGLFFASILFASLPNNPNTLGTPGFIEKSSISLLSKNPAPVSVTTTINWGYGNGVTVTGAGFLLNNEMDDFSIKPGVPNVFGLLGNTANAIEPGKRMLSSMSPTIVETPDGELFLVLGSPGGSTIITTTAQVIMNVIDFDMNIEDAVESYRFHHQWLPDMIQFESSRFSPETVNALENRGHAFKYRGSIGEARTRYNSPLGASTMVGDMELSMRCPGSMALAALPIKP
jgi:gamma-glutamyltranspeptidase/glutathione hydrolase